jgi:hypothetical protein
MIWATVVWVSERAMFRIDAVNVVGTRVVSKEQIILLAQNEMMPKLLGGINRANTLFVPTPAIIEKISNESDWIKHVDTSVERHTLNILLEERAPELLWCLPSPDALTSSSSEEVRRSVLEGCYFVNKEGYIFGKAPDYSGRPFVIFESMPSSTLSVATGTTVTIGGYILPPDELRRVTHLQNLLLAKGVVVEQVIARDPGDYLFRIDRPWKLLVSTIVEPEEIVRRLNLVEEEIAKEHTDATPVSVIDLRFGNKIFYR